MGRSRPGLVVVGAEPADEVEHVGVAPHPGGEPPEARQRIDGLGVVAAAADVAVDAIGVRPVGLDGDGGEPLLADQPLGDLGALAVELVRPVRRLAEQHEARVADQIQQRVVVIGRADERISGPRRAGSPGRRSHRLVAGRHRIGSSSYPVAAASGAAARARRSRTSSSVVWEKSSYQRPTA